MYNINFISAGVQKQVTEMTRDYYFYIARLLVVTDDGASSAQFLHGSETSYRATWTAGKPVTLVILIVWDDEMMAGIIYFKPIG